MGRHAKTNTSKIIQYYRKGVEMSDIAKVLGLSLPTVRKVLIELGLHTPRETVSQEIKDEVINRVKFGESVTKVAKETGYNESTIYGWLRRAGIEKPSATVEAPKVEEEVTTSIEVSDREIKRIANSVLINYIKTDIGRAVVEEKGMVKAAEEVENIVKFVLEKVKTA